MTVPASVTGLVITSSPGSMPIDAAAAWIAAVQELVATACLTPSMPANRSHRFLTFLPCQ